MSVGSDSCYCAVEGPRECTPHPATTFIIIIITTLLFSLECSFASSDTAPPPRPQLSLTYHSSVHSSHGELHKSVNAVLLFYGGRILEPRWSSLTGGLSLPLRLPKPCFMFANLPAADRLGFPNIMVHCNLLPSQAWGT